MLKIFSVVACAIVLGVAAVYWFPDPGSRSELDHKRHFLKQANREFTYFGRLQDERGHPIESAKVTGLLTIYSLRPGSNEIEHREKIEAVSDETGRFKLHGKGTSLRIVVQHPDFLFKSDDRLVIHMDPDEGEAQPRLGTAATPASIVGWRKAELPHRNSLLGGEVRAKFRPDGQFQTLTLGRSGVAVEVAISREESSTFEQPGDWSATIKLPGGLVQLAENGPLIEAPAEGYRERWTADFDKNYSEWSYRLAHTFYFKTAAPVRYGSLAVEWTAFYNPQGDATVRATYKLNTEGKRLLMSAEDFP